MGAGIPSHSAVPMSVRLGLMPSMIDSPPVYHWTSAEMMLVMPRVVTIELTLTFVTMKPLIVPTNQPISTAPMTATPSGSPFLDMMPAHAREHRPASGPSDRSN